MVYTDKGVFLETLGFILYNNTFVVDSLLSDVYLIDIYSFVHYHSLIGLHIKFVLLRTLEGDPYIYNIISPGNEPTDEELLQFITGKYSPATKQLVLVLFCLVYSGPNTELLAKLGSKP